MQGRGHDSRNAGDFQKLKKPRKQILSSDASKKPALQTEHLTLAQWTWFWSSKLRNCKILNLWCFKPLFLFISWQWQLETSTYADEHLLVFFSFWILLEVYLIAYNFLPSPAEGLSDYNITFSIYENARLISCILLSNCLNLSLIKVNSIKDVIFKYIYIYMFLVVKIYFIPFSMSKLPLFIVCTLNRTIYYEYFPHYLFSSSCIIWKHWWLNFTSKSTVLGIEERWKMSKFCFLFPVIWLFLLMDMKKIKLMVWRMLENLLNWTVNMMQKAFRHSCI